MNVVVVVAVVQQRQTLLPHDSIVIDDLFTSEPPGLRLSNETVERATPPGGHDQRDPVGAQATPQALDQIGPGVVEKQTVGTQDHVVLLAARGPPLEHLAADRTVELVAVESGPHVLHGRFVAVGDGDGLGSGELGREQAGQAGHAAPQLQHALPREQREVRANVITEGLLRRPNANVAGVIKTHQVLGGERAISVADFDVKV